MLSFEKMRELADQAHRDYDRLVADGTCPPLWSAVFGHLVAKEAQAATLATVTPLVQQLADGLEHHMLQTRPITMTENLLAKARAFLSVATKESTDHG